MRHRQLEAKINGLKPMNQLVLFMSQNQKYLTPLDLIPQFIALKKPLIFGSKIRTKSQLDKIRLSPRHFRSVHIEVLLLQNSRCHRPLSVLPALALPGVGCRCQYPSAKETRFFGQQCNINRVILFLLGTPC